MKRPKIVRLRRIPKPIWGVSKLPKLLKTLDQISTIKKVNAVLLGSGHYLNREDYMRMWHSENGIPIDVSPVFTKIIPDDYPHFQILAAVDPKVKEALEKGIAMHEIGGQIYYYNEKETR